VGKAFATAAGDPGTLGKAYHTTGEEWMTWNQYYTTMAEVVGAPAPNLVHIPTTLLAKVAPRRGLTALENFQFSNIFDNTAAHMDLGFRYTIPWREGVRRTVAWLESRGMLRDSDQDTVDDQIIAAWQRMGARLVDELKPLDA
jgi:nucleoside-diphosphate-sugar epimerase